MCFCVPYIRRIVDGGTVASADRTVASADGTVAPTDRTYIAGGMPPCYRFRNYAYLFALPITKSGYS